MIPGISPLGCRAQRRKIRATCIRQRWEFSRPARCTGNIFPPFCRAMAEGNRIELAPEVVDAVPEGRGIRLHFADGATCMAAAAVLAIGNLPSSDQETA